MAPFLSIPRSDGSAELLFDILEAAMHRYVAMLPFTYVNMCSALSDVNTALNISSIIGGTTSVNLVPSDNSHYSLQKSRNPLGTWLCCHS